MKINLDKVYGRMRELKLTQDEVVELLQKDGVKMSRATFNSRLKGTSYFKMSELSGLAKVLAVPADQYAQYLIVEE